MGQLKIVCAQLGPIDTNTYILMDDEIKEAIMIRGSCAYMQQNRNRKFLW